MTQEEKVYPIYSIGEVIRLVNCEGTIGHEELSDRIGQEATIVRDIGEANKGGEYDAYFIQFADESGDTDHHVWSRHIQATDIPFEAPTHSSTHVEEKPESTEVMKVEVLALPVDMLDKDAKYLVFIDSRKITNDAWIEAMNELGMHDRITVVPVTGDVTNAVRAYSIPSKNFKITDKST